MTNNNFCVSFMALPRRWPHREIFTEILSNSEHVLVRLPVSLKSAATPTSKQSLRVTGNLNVSCLTKDKSSSRYLMAYFFVWNINSRDKRLQVIVVFYTLIRYVERCNQVKEFATPEIGYSVPEVNPWIRKGDDLMDNKDLRKERLQSYRTDDIVIVGSVDQLR